MALNQLTGFGVFWLLSNYLTKQQFGDFNWALAVLLAAFNLLMLGLDQLLVRKIAAGENEQKTMCVYFTHVLVTGSAFCLLILLLWLLLPGNVRLQILAGLCAGKLMLYFSNPFKQLANGKERFGLLTMMSVGSGLVKCVGLLLMAWLHGFTLQTAICLFVIAETIELLVAIGIYILRLRLPLTVSFDLGAYQQLLKEARHQAGVVVFTSALSRFDWIFIGLFLSSVKLAEYSFAYKVFEIATLPLAAIGALLLPRFSNLIQRQQYFPPSMFNLLDWEIVFAVFTALLLNICWLYFADPLTHHKYGTVNNMVILMLSLSIPFLYINNFLWTIAFAKGQTKLILQIFTITFAVNFMGDIFLIPLIGNEGAALGYLAAMVVQSVLFCSKVNEAGYRPIIVTGTELAAALGIGYFTRIWFHSFIPAMLFACANYLLFILLIIKPKALSTKLVTEANLEANPLA